MRKNLFNKWRLTLFITMISLVFASGQVLLSEDFSTATGTTPPTGWVNNDIAVSTEVWAFDNPGFRVINSPMSSPSAIFDSDAYASGPAEDAALESPSFNAATATGSIILSFDHYFYSGYGGAYAVEVFNGSVWDTVLEGSAASTANPQSESIDITSAANGSATAKVRFHWTGDYSWYWIVDNVKVEAVTCTTPAALGATNITATSADIYWTTGGATDWNYVYDTAGFTPMASNALNTTNDTVSLSGLLPNTTYEFYVRDSCGAGDVSAWVGPFAFTTACNTVTVLPFNETANLSSGTLNCWTAVDGNADGDSWSLNTSTSYVQEGDASFQVYTDFNGGNNDDYLISPGITLTGNERLKFWYRARSASEPNDYKVLLSTTGNDTADFTTELLVDTASSTTYAEHIIDLSSYTGTVYLAWHIPPGGLDGWYLYIDNITVEAIPSCIAPTALGADNITTSSADIFWTTGGASNWDIQYDTAGFNLGTGMVVNVTNDTTTITGLSSNTAYEFYVRDSCAVGDVSIWVGPYTFTTLCNAITSLPFNETANLSSGTLNCWTAVDGNADGDSWSLNTSTSYVQEGDASFQVYTDFNGGSNDDYLISPGITLTGNERLKFWYRARSASEPNDYKVLLSTTGNDTADFTTELLVDTASSTTYAEHIIDLSSYTGTVYLAWHIPPGGLDGWYLYIDNITVEAIPSCPDPTALGATNITSSDADLFWTTGGASNWDIQYDTAGFNLGTGMVVNATNDTTSITGLSPNTAYEFYVRDSCAVGNSSMWVGPFAFVTACGGVQTLPYTESFDISQGCFSITDGGTSSDTWEQVDSYTGSTLDGTGFMFVDSDGAGSGAGLLFETMTTPYIDASVLAGSLILEFDHYFNSVFGGDNGAVEVYDGNTWNTVYTVTPTTGGWNSPDHQFINISAYANDSLQVRFVYDDNNTWAWFWAVDNFQLRDVPCIDPQALGAINIGPYTADAIWSGAANSTNWNVEFDTTGFTLGTGTNTIVATNDTTTLTGLAANTTYDFYVQSNCGANGNSGWSGPYTFTTTIACPTPINLTATSITDTSAELNWTALNATSWTLIYGGDGFDPATGGTSVTVTSLPYHLGGLAQDSAYDFYVASDCGVDGTSDTSFAGSFMTIETCPSPISVVVDTITASSAVVSWANSNQGTMWDIEYGPMGYTQGTGTLVAGTSHPYQLSGLTDNTCYDVYVRNNCGTNGNSVWVGPITFCTTCLPQSLPFVENFNTGLGCFIIVNGGADAASWEHAPTGGSTTSGDIDGSPYMIVDSDEHGNGVYMRETLTSAPIDASSLSVGASLLLEFDQFFNDIGTADTGIVEVFDGTAWQEVYRNNSSADVGSFASPDHQLIDITAYANANLQVRFVYDDGNTWAWWWAIDNVSIREVLCADPTATQMINIGSNTATVDVTSGGVAFDFEYGPVGFVQGTGTFVSGAASPYVINGLTDNTCYDVYVRNNCTGTNNGFSAWIGPITFCTTCLPQSLPFTENFSSGLGCFIETDGGTNALTWQVEPATGSSLGGNLDGTDYAGVGDPVNLFIGMDELLTSAPINAGNLSSGASLIMEFDQAFNIGFSTPTGYLEVYDGTVWDTVYTVSSTIGGFSAPNRKTIDLTAYADTNMQVRFRFVDASSFFSYWAVDNISIAEVACADPLNPQMTIIGSNSATVQVSSGGTAFDFEYGPAGFIQGTGTLITGSTNPYQITGLTDNTCYDVYVRNNCSANSNGVSAWVGPITFCTTCLTQSLPFTEDFNTGVGCFNIIDGSSDGATWFNAPNGGTPNAVGDIDGTPYMIVDSDQDGNGVHMREMLLSAPIDAGSINPNANLWLEFDQFFNDAGTADTGIVEVFDGTMWQEVYRNNATTDVGIFGNPDHQIIDITAYANAALQVRFTYDDGNTWAWWWAIDNVTVREVNCTPTTGVGTYYVSSDSAAVNWTPGSAVTQYVEYGLSGFTPGTGTLLAPTDSFAMFGGLTDATLYDVYVIDSCDGSYGDTVGPITFRTLCLPQTLPYVEDFDVDLGCFSVTDGGTSLDTWMRVSDYFSSTLDGTGFAFVDSDGAGSGPTLNEVMTTPFIDASTIVGALTIEFDQYFNNLNASDSGFVEVFDGTSWVEVYSINADLGGWNNPNHQLIDVTAYANSNFQARLVYRDNGSYAWYWAVDNFSIRDVTCPAPDSLGATNILSSSADLFWSTGGSSNWNIEFDTVGFTLGNGIMLNATNDTLNISNLTPATTYEFYVRDSCGPGDVSTWSGPFTFTTSCVSINTFPWIEDFESSQNVIPTCWENEAGDDADWIFRNGSIGHGATTDHTLGTASGYYAGMDDSNTLTTDTVNNLLTPSFDITALSAPRLNFFYYIGNDNLLTSKLYIDIFDGTSWNMGVDTVLYSQAAWLQHIVDLTPYKSANTRIRFRGVETTDFNSDISIDDVMVEQSPTCPNPTALGADNITSTSADLFWTGGGASNWDIEYGLGGFTPGTGMMMSVTNDTVSISGLQPSSAYEFYVRDSCGLGDVSYWSGPYVFNTLCGPISTFPWIEDFEISQTAIPNCWENETGDDADWIFRNGAIGHGATTDHTLGTAAGYYAGMDDSNTLTTDTVNNLLTPVFDLTVLNIPYLYFYHFIGNDATLTSTLHIDVYDGTNWNMGVHTVNFTQAAWLKDSVDLSMYKSANTRIRFRGVETTDFNSDLSIDDVSIEEAGNPFICFPPTSLSASNETCTSADVNWVSTIGMNSSIVEYGTAGFTPGTGTFINFVSSPQLVTGLAPGTTYEFYVADTCGGDTTAWVGPVSFTTASGPISASFSYTINGFVVDFDASASVGATSYTWDFGDGNNGTGVTTQHTYAAGGSYSVILTVTGDCGTDVDTVTVVGVSLSENAISRSLEVYPNPTSGKVNVSFLTGSSDAAVMSILDLSGKVIMRVTEENTNGKYDSELNLSKLAKGTYVLKIESGDINTVKRIVKQ